MPDIRNKSFDDAQRILEENNLYIKVEGKLIMMRSRKDILFLSILRKDKGKT